MSKDPAFLFYYENYSHGTRLFTFEQKGAYMDLLIEQADNYSLSVETIKEILKEKFDELWPVIKSKFKKERNDKFFNERLRREQEKRKNYSESRRINRTKSKIKPEKHMNNISKRYDVHMEDKDKDKDKDKNKDKIIVKNKDKTITWRTSFEEYLKITNKSIKELIADKEELNKQQEFNPNLDLILTLKKSYTNFWGTKAGWVNKKKKRTGDIDMRMTFINSLSQRMNKVYKNTDEEENTDPNGNQLPAL